MKQTLLISALALSAGLANAQTMMEMPKMQNEAVKADFATVKLVDQKLKLSENAKLTKNAYVQPKTAEAGVVKYTRPACVFNIGFSHDYYSLNKNAGLHPAYQEITWKNASTGATGFSWEYSDPESADGGTLFAETTDLVSPAYPFTLIMAPTLSANVAGQTVTYQQKYSNLIAGGNNDQQDRLWGACTYDVVGATATEDGLRATYEFGFGHKSNESWPKLLDGVTKAEVLGLGTIYAKPEVPYALSYVYVNALETSLSASTILKITVYKVDDEGYIGEELATGTCTKADYVCNENGMVTALFTLERQEGELSETVDLTIDSAIYVELSVENMATTDQFNPFAVWATDEDGYDEPFGSLVHLKVDGKDSFIDATGLVTTTGSKMRGFTMNLGVTNSWMFTEDGKYQSTVPVEGGSCSFKVNSFFALEEYATADGEGIYDWWEPTYGTFNPQTGLQDLTFTLQALPAEMTGRTCVAKVAIPGVKEQVFTIIQGEDGGVESVETSASSAQVVDDNFVVSSTAADAVKVYNVSGQLVASANLDGTAVIPAAKLAKGLYVVRFNDNTVVKVMK